MSPVTAGEISNSLHAMIYNDVTGFDMTANSGLSARDWGVRNTVLNNCPLIMVALCNRADHYILPCYVYLLSIFFFSSPNLSGRRLDVYHTLTHGVALVRI